MLGIEQIVKLLKLADDDNPFGLSLLEQRRKWRIDEIHEMDIHIERSKNQLNSMNDQIASSKQLLNTYTISCERKRQESENPNSKISGLDALVGRFKTNNEEYLKIQQTVGDKVKSVLTDSKLLLQFALALVIEALRRNPDKYNNLLVCNAFSWSTAIISVQQASSQLHYNEDYNAIILDVADKLYSTLLKQLVDTIMEILLQNLSSSS